MSFLSGILANLGKWLLEKLGSFLAAGYQKITKRKEIDNEEQPLADAQKEIVAAIYKIEDEIEVHKAAGAVVPKELLEQIVELEEKLSELSIKNNSGFFS